MSRSLSRFLMLTAIWITKRQDADEDDQGADPAIHEPGLQGRVLEVAHPPRRAHQADDVDGRPGHPVADHPAPEATWPQNGSSRNPKAFGNQ